MAAPAPEDPAAAAVARAILGLAHEMDIEVLAQGMPAPGPAGGPAAPLTAAAASRLLRLEPSPPPAAPAATRSA